jgi:uncharacterized protein YegP (UPF0339 family)
MYQPELTFERYKDKADEWRWRLKAKNGKIIADSSEGYKNLADCDAMINKIKQHGSSANVI